MKDDAKTFFISSHNGVKTCLYKSAFSSPPLSFIAYLYFFFIYLIAILYFPVSFCLSISPLFTWLLQSLYFTFGLCFLCFYLLLSLYFTVGICPTISPSLFVWLLLSISLLVLSLYFLPLFACLLLSLIHC